MIALTRLDNTRFHLNPDLLELIEEAGDTVVMLTNGHRFLVRESVNDIIQQVDSYKVSLLRKQAGQDVTLLRREGEDSTTVREAVAASAAAAPASSGRGTKPLP